MSSNASGPGSESRAAVSLSGVASESCSPQSFQPVIGFVQGDQLFLTLLPEKARCGNRGSGQQTHTKNADDDLPVKVDRRNLTSRSSGKFRATCSLPFCYGYLADL